MPLIGTTGMMKNNVMKRIPCFFLKIPTVPHLPHFIGFAAGCDPHEKKWVPTMMKETMSLLLPVIRTLFHVRIGALHPTLWPVQLDKAKWFVNSMRVFC